MDERSFIPDYKMIKQIALHEFVLSLILEVIEDKDKKRSVTEKFEVIKRIIDDAVESEEEN